MKLLGEHFDYFIRHVLSGIVTKNGALKIPFQKDIEWYYIINF